MGLILFGIIFKYILLFKKIIKSFFSIFSLNHLIYFLGGEV